ncbi:MAG TPA: hypothetical protein VK165_02315 [Azonexus sp.]|nr:hypothetical protein [Azonexus sp.]
MKKTVAIAMATCIATSSAPALAACNTEPALELRNAFITQYAGRGASKGEALDKVAKEAGCIFDVMADRLTVKAYTRIIKDMQAGRKPGAEMDALVPEFKKNCVQPG